MNAFAIRSTKEDGRYRGEYRLAHKCRFSPVQDERGKPRLFADRKDAFQAAAAEFLKLLNSDTRYWRGPCKDEARDLAEKLFKGTGNGQGKTEEAKASLQA